MLFRGFCFGMLLQLAIGPVCLFVFGTAVEEGFAPAVAAVLGTALTDGGEIVLAILGVRTVLEKIEPCRAAFSVVRGTDPCGFWAVLHFGQLWYFAFAQLWRCRGFCGRRFWQGCFACAFQPVDGAVLGRYLCFEDPDGWNAGARFVVVWGGLCAFNTHLFNRCVLARRFCRRQYSGGDCKSVEHFGGRGAAAVRRTHLYPKATVGITHLRCFSAFCIPDLGALAALFHQTEQKL